MIMTKTPLRITFVGGGTDIPEYYRANGPGNVVSSAISKYIHIIVNKKFDSKIRVSYSKTEIVDRIEDIEHPTVREALKMLGITGGIEIVSISDIPSGGTGLGSSSSFLVGLLNALHAWDGELVPPEQLAGEAVKIERGILKEPGGKQDQYIAAYGGLKRMQFNKNESVTMHPIVMKEDASERLEESLLLMYTGIQRSSAEISAKQTASIHGKMDAYDKLGGMVAECAKAMEKGDIERLGELMYAGWRIKKSFSEGITNDIIESYYAKALKAGAYGGKLIGAGGGGFMLFVVPQEKRNSVIKALPGLREEKFHFEPSGSRIVLVGE